jgi:hypothetical protein
MSSTLKEEIRRCTEKVFIVTCTETSSDPCSPKKKVKQKFVYILKEPEWKYLKKLREQEYKFLRRRGPLKIGRPSKGLKITVKPALLLL